MAHAERRHQAGRVSSDSSAQRDCAEDDVMRGYDLGVRALLHNLGTRKGFSVKRWPFQRRACTETAQGAEENRVPHPAGNWRALEGGKAS
jgi:hypothetical protein